MLRNSLIGVRDAIAAGTGFVLAGSVPAARLLLRGTAPLAQRFRIARRFHRQVVDSLAGRLKTRGGAMRTIRLGSVALTLDVSGFGARYHYFAGECYESETTQLFLSAIRPGDVVVDVGANHGYFTVLSAQLTGSAGRVTAFEANPGPIAILERHVRANRVEDRVEIVEAAVSDRDGQQVQFYVGNDDADLYSSICPSEFALQQGWINPQRAITASTRSLDSWLAGRGRPHVRLLKIDVEGAEDLVVRGMALMLAEAPPDYIVCETTWGSPAHNAFVGHGYQSEKLCGTEDYGNMLYTRSESVQ